MNKKRNNFKKKGHQIFAEGVDILLSVRCIHSRNTDIVCAEFLHLVMRQEFGCQPGPSCEISMITAIRILAGYADGEHPSGRHDLHKEG